MFRLSVATAPDHRSDEAWITELRAHDPSTVEALSQWLRGALAKVVGGGHDVNDADLDDFTQESVVHVLGRLDRFSGDSRFTTWATAVAIRVALTRLRKRRHAAIASPEAITVADRLPAPGGTPHGLTAKGELLAHLRQSIETDLTPKQREALKAFLSGTPQVVLAEGLGMTGGAFHKLMHDARQRLKRALQRRGHTDDAVRSILQGAV